MNLPFGKKRVSNVGSGEEKGQERKGTDVRRPGQPAIDTNRHTLTLSDHAGSESLKEVVRERGMVSSRRTYLITVLACPLHFNA